MATYTQFQVRAQGPSRDHLELLISILRLRCQKAPSYKEIAVLLTKLWPTAMVRLARHAVPKETRTEVLSSDKGIKEWLARYVEEIYELAEGLGFESWTAARDEPQSIVEEVLKLTGLKALGYKAAEMDEPRWQMKWKKEGDWRYGSIPDLAEEETPLNTVFEPTIQQPPSPPLSVTQKTTRNVTPGLQSKEQRAAYNPFNNPCCNTKEQGTASSPFCHRKSHSYWKPRSEELVDISYEDALAGLDKL